MARQLDKQVDKHQTDKQVLKAEDTQIGLRMAEDVKQHYLEEERVKQARLSKNKKHMNELEKLIDQRQKIADYIASSAAFLAEKKRREEAAAER